jgi:hypothetical protein
MTQNKEISEQQQRAKERRAQLRELSKIAKMRMSADCEGMTVNEILIEEFYTDEENEEFKTLHQWSKDGYKVNKGAVSFLVWGKPKPMKKGEESAPKETTEEGESEFYPLCYLFSNAQVTKR